GRSGVGFELLKELEDYGLLAPVGSGADKRYPETDADVAAVCAQLVRFGVDGRHLRTFRTATDRESALLEQLIAPALRSRNNERRAAGLSDLQSLAELAQELVGLLLWRDVRDLASRRRRWISARGSARSTTSRRPASASRTSRRCSPTRRRYVTRSPSWPGGSARSAPMWCWARRRAGSSSAPRSPRRPARGSSLPGVR